MEKRENDTAPHCLPFDTILSTKQYIVFSYPSGISALTLGRRSCVLPSSLLSLLILSSTFFDLGMGTPPPPVLPSPRAITYGTAAVPFDDDVDVIAVVVAAVVSSTSCDATHRVVDDDSTAVFDDDDVKAEMDAGDATTSNAISNGKLGCCCCRDDRTETLMMMICYFFVSFSFWVVSFTHRRTNNYKIVMTIDDDE